MNAPKQSPYAKNFSARVAAVQIVYQALYNDQSLREVLEEHKIHRASPPVEGEALPPADAALRAEIVLGVEARLGDLKTLVKAHYARPDKEIEFLLRAILLCAAWELLYHKGVDAPLIINEYLNITRSFYGSGEVSLVNGILDSLAKTMRNPA